MKNKILYCLVLFFIAVLSFSLCIDKNIFKIKKASAASKPTVSVSASNEYNGEAYPVDGSVKLKISLSEPATENIFVYYKTIDYTASSANEDYDEITEESNTFVNFRPNEQERTIDINVANDEFATSKVDNSSFYNSRMFKFVIYKTADGSCDISSTNSTIFCHIGAEYIYNIVTDWQGKYALEKTSGIGVEYKDSGRNDETQDENWHWSTYDFSYFTNDSIIKNYYLGKGLGSFYFQGEITVDEETDGGHADLWLAYQYGSADTFFNACKFYIGDIPYYKTIYSFRYNAYFNEKGKSDDDYIAGRQGNYKDSSGIHSTNNPYGDQRVARSFIYRDNITSYYFKVYESNATKFGFSYKCNTSHDKHFSSPWVRVVFFDDEAPEIVNYSVDKSVVNSDGKIYLRVKFDEPVCINFNEGAPSITATINSDAIKAGNVVTFDYVDGEYTDTLLFAIDANTISFDGLITKFSLQTFNHSTSIKDLSSWRNGLTDMSSKIPDKYRPSFLNCDLEDLNIDLRTPVFEESKITVGKYIQKSYSIQVDVSDFDYTYGKLYYTWSDDATQTNEIKRTDDYKSQATISGKKFVINTEGISGVRFLWLKAVSQMGKEASVIVGPYYFDNTTETIEAITYVDGDNLQATKTKKISFVVDYSKNYIASSSLQSINIITSTSSTWDENTEYKINDGVTTASGKMKNFITLTTPSTKLVGDPEVTTKQANKLEFKMFETSESTYLKSFFEVKDDSGEKIAVDYTYKVKYTIEVSYSDIGIQDGEYEKLYLGINIADSLGNTMSAGSYKYSTSLAYFDSREILELTQDYRFVDSTKKLALSETERIYYKQNLAFDFELDSDISSSNYELVVKSPSAYQKKLLEYNELLASLDENDTKPEAPSEYLSSSEVSELFDIKVENGTIGASKVTVTLKEDSDDIYGYYLVYFKVTKDDDVKFTVDFDFYLVDDDLIGDTVNYTNISNYNVVTNKLYKISEETNYYYIDEHKNVISENYGAKGSSLYFSSEEAAIDYLTYMEYQDLCLVRIDSEQIANNINNNINGYIKAESDSAYTAKVNQYWIRYKRSTWTSSNTENIQWCYYYYPNQLDTINYGSLRTALTSAIDSVVANIIKEYGSYVYLNKLFGLDDDRIPSIDESSIRPDHLAFKYTKSNSEFTSSYDYNGDQYIYNSTVSYTTLSGNTIDLKLASTYKLDFSNNTHLFYKEYDSQSDYKELTSKDGTMLKNALSSLEKSGAYTFIEIDSFGAHKFDIYIDKDAPTLKASYVEKDDNNKEITKTTTTDSSSSSYSFSEVSFTISSIISEIDEYSYVAIYTSSVKLKAVYSMSELTDPITLDQGRYTIEVCDRSGNYYTISLTLNDSDLVVNVDIPTDYSYLRVRVQNRTEDDIYRYEIYRSNVLVDSTFKSANKYTESGLYTIIVEDWYGNMYYDEVEYVRRSPSITFRYNDGTGYTTYKENTIDARMRLEEIAENAYNVYIACPIELKYEAQINAIVEVLEGKDDIVYTDTIKGTDSIFRLETIANCMLKVSYSAYPDIYAVYNIIVDDKVPTINLYYEKSEYIDLEYDDLTSKIENSTALKEGMVLTPTRIGYFKKDGTSTNKKILNGSKICSNLINVEISDESGISLIEVYKDNATEPIIKTTNADDIKTITEYGEYLIYATDVLGNKSVFKFKNIEKSDVKCYVDETLKDLPASSIDLFSENGEYQNVFYGSKSLEAVFSYDSEISYLIKIGASTLYYSFEYEDGKLYSRTYVVDINENIPLYDESGTRVILPYTFTYTTINGKVLLDINDFSDKTKTYGTYYQVYSLDNQDEGIDLYATITSDNELKLKLLSSSYENEVYMVELKIQSSEINEPIYVKCGLSLLKSDIEIKNENGIIETNQKGKTIYANGIIELKEENIDSSIVSKIRVSYSLKNDFKTYVDVYESQEFNTYKFTDDGFYLIEITNIYSNVTTYTIAYSNNCMIVTDVEYQDGASNVYSNAYTEEIFNSNKQVTFEIYTDNPTYTVYKGKDSFDVELEEKDGYYILKLDKPGYYQVNIIDKYGNIFSKNVEIETQSVNVSNNLITGYATKALKYSEGYTKNKLSIDYDELLISGIKYIRVTKDKNSSVIYDELSENKTLIEKENLNNIVGELGSGDYEIEFRDAYGNKKIIKVKYKEESTLTIYRFTLTGIVDEKIDLEKAESEGVYSNNIIKLVTTSSAYKLFINGSSKKFTNNTYTLEFVTETLTEGSIDYTISYLDDYGFEHNIECHLIRQTVTFDPIDLKCKVKDGQNYTSDNVYVTFDSEYTCTYTIDGSKKIAYTSGTRLKNDGKYVFTLQDKSGNEDNYVVTKDTVVDAEFKSSKTNQSIIRNQVITDGAVVLSTNSKDGIEVVSVFKNGYLQSNELRSFKDTGKWEILLKDRVGNETIFTFYVITHEVAQFNYTTPKNFVVSSLYKVDSDGLKISYLSKIYNESTQFDLTEDGVYQVTLFSLLTNEVTAFSVTVSTMLPDATLSGVEDGSKTSNIITISNTKAGDTIYIYKDGELYNTYLVENDGDTPEVNEKGYFEVEVVNQAGNTVNYCFTRKYVPNAAGSALIAISLSLVAIGLFVALVYRNKSRIDK